MSNEGILSFPINRLTLLRLTAQTYCRLQNILGPLIISIKALSSRACELASPEELELPVRERDPTFVGLVQKFIMNLRHFDKILPFQRKWVKDGQCLVGFVVSCDGSKLVLSPLQKKEISTEI